MNGMIGMSELMLEEEMSPKARNMAATIHDCTSGLLNLLNAILDFSKLEANKLDLEYSIVIIEKIVSSSLFLFEAKASSKGLSVDFELDDDVPSEILTDETRLRQILLNLIGNAIKFTSEGKIAVNVYLRSTNEISFSVKDSGIGISKEDQQRLFQSFTQVDASTTRKFGGTGLGLAICKGLVDAMNGSIWIESELGQGATFTFSIPFIPKSAKKPQISTPVHDISILVAEDNTINQDLMKGFMNQMGYSPDYVSNGKDAVEAMTMKNYDIVFLDAHMPIMDGYDAAREIRKLSQSQNSPWIAALTANALESEIQKSFDAGMNAHYTKPFTKRILVQAITEMMDSKTKVA